jgi:hypothetical protein
LYFVAATVTVLITTEGDDVEQPDALTPASDPFTIAKRRPSWAASESAPDVYASMHSSKRASAEVMIISMERLDSTMLCPLSELNSESSRINLRC